MSLFSFFIIDSQPLSKCFRSNCTVSDIPHNRFCFPDRAFPFSFLFPNKNIKTKMVKVFYRRFRPLSSLDEGGGRAVGHALAVCRRCDFSGSGKDGCQVRHCLLTGASSRRGAEVGHYAEHDELELGGRPSIRLESKGEVSWLPWLPLPSTFCWSCIHGAWPGSTATATAPCLLASWPSMNS